jgi:hypothetical protein
MAMPNDAPSAASPTNLVPDSHAPRRLAAWLT